MRMATATSWFCAAALVVALCAGVADAITTKHFCYSTPSLLGGDLTSCRTPTDTTVCTGGYASSEAWVRYFRSKGEPTLHLFPLDFLSSFAQMHSMKWDVNAPFYAHYGAKAWVSLPNILVGSNNPQMNQMRRSDFPWILTNIDIKPDSQFVQYRNTAWVDQETLIGFIVFATSSNTDYNYDIISAGMRGLEQLSRQTPAPKHVIVMDMNTNTGANYTTNLAALQQQSLFKIDAYYLLDASTTTGSWVMNGTFIATVKGEGYSRSGVPGSNLACIDLQLDTSGKVFNLSFATYPITPIPAFLRDSNYYADVAFAQTLAEQAIVDDPVIGYTTALPLVSDLGAGINNCLAGDCGVGNMFTDAFRWRMGTDVAMFNSGGVRGSGWPAGQRHYSDTFAADPWPDTMNVATLTGLSLWEILNASMSVPMTNANPTGGSSSIHLQISGIKVSYGFYLRPVKLLSVDILNRQTGVYEPLDRLKLYQVLMTVYEVCCMEPYATIMNKARYRGETAAVDHPDLPLQRVLAEFLQQTTTAANPYVITENTRHTRVDTGVTSANAMNWHQVQADCPVNTFWDAGIATCMPCPLGLVQPSTGQTTCQPPAASVDIAAIVAPIVSIFVLACVIIGIAIGKSSANTRSTANAPTSGRITIMFTDIQDSTRLWGALPVSMNKALGQHHDLIRAAIAKHKGYEVKTIGDSFMIAVSSEDAAVQIAVDIQRSLQAASWPPCIARAYEAATDDDLELIDDDPDASAVHDPVFNGLRVRIGMHCGEPKAELDAVTKGYDYYGPMVNVAARVESAARGGQICCSTEVMTRLQSKAGLSVRSLGRFDLKGVSEGAELHEVLPDELATRRRLAFNDGADGNGGGGGQLPTTNSTDQFSDVVSNSDMGAEPPEVRPSLLVLNFTRGLLRAMSPGEANKVRTALMKAWHINDDGTDRTDDSALERLCRRVLPSALRQAVAQQRTIKAVDDGDAMTLPGAA